MRAFCFVFFPSSFPNRTNTFSSSTLSRLFKYFSRAFLYLPIANTNRKVKREKRDDLCPPMTMTTNGTTSRKMTFARNQPRSKTFHVLYTEINIGNHHHTIKRTHTNAHVHTYTIKQFVGEKNASKYILRPNENEIKLGWMPARRI